MEFCSKLSDVFGDAVPLLPSSLKGASRTEAICFPVSLVVLTLLLAAVTRGSLLGVRLSCRSVSSPKSEANPTIHCTFVAHSKLQEFF